MNETKLTISLNQEEYDIIRKFCKDNAYNLSLKTVHLWLKYIKEQEKKK